VSFVNNAVRGTQPHSRISRVHVNIGYWLHRARKLNAQLNRSLQVSDRVFGSWSSPHSSSCRPKWSLLYVDAVRHAVRIFGVHKYGSSVLKKYTFLGSLLLLLFTRRYWQMKWNPDHGRRCGEMFHLERNMCSGVIVVSFQYRLHGKQFAPWCCGSWHVVRW
jgi:hypothetical protein